MYTPIRQSSHTPHLPATTHVAGGAQARATALRVPPAARVAAVRTLDDALQWAEELGLRGTLQDLQPDGAWTGLQSSREQEDFERLQADAQHRATHAHAAGYENTLKTMLHWVALFELAYPNYVLFLPLHEPDTHVVNACHNEGTLSAIRVFMDRHGSLQRGREGQKTSSEGKAGVTSTLRAFRSVEARYDVCDPRFNQLLSKLGQQMRREDAPRSERAMSQGIRAMHLVQLRERGVPVSTFDWALGHASLQVIARGGEPGLRDRQQQYDFQPARGCVWSDFRWRTEAESQSEFPSLDLLWYPAKDGSVTHRKVPIPISRLHSGPRGAHPGCPYDAIRALWDERNHQVPACPPGCQHEGCVRSRTPFFRTDAGVIVDTSYMAALGRRWAEALGLELEGVGGKWARIGCATDVMDAMGLVEGAGILRQRGRWRKDLGEIYARLSAARQLDASRRMAGSRSFDMTARAGWAQPTWR